MSANFWIVSGAIVGAIGAAYATIAIPYGFHLKGKSKTPVKIGEIDVKQKAENLSDVTGAEISNPQTDLELGKVNIEQEGNSLKNVTGMRMDFDANSGEVKLKDKLQVKQQGQHGQSSITFNAEQPGVEITFNKKSKENKNEE